MKKYITLLLVALLPLFICVETTSCSTPPDKRVQQVQTLKVVGHSAEASVQLTAELEKSGSISHERAKQVYQLYDEKFQPTFRIAVYAATNNLDAAAPEQLISLAAQLSSLVLSLQTPHP